ncbi:MAG: PQQ-dependent dehydrogenase, methanol/ethanol family [Gemmatimonadota bacterium]
MRLRGSAPPVLEGLTFERLVQAGSAPADWLTYHGTYDGHRYSALDQINRENVRDLRVAWAFQFGMVGLIANPATYAFEATPLVVDGVLFVSGPAGYVWALDGATGEMLWQYQHPVPLDVPLCCGNVNRGVAVGRGKVFYASPEGQLVALDGVTGKPVWKQTFLDYRAGESSTAAPLVVKNLVLVGNAGGEYGVRGHLDAFDVETGKPVWRTYTVPAPGEPGSDTWPADDAWARGGGTTWITGTYDPELDLIYWGTSNPGPPFDGSVRPGANLYTNSILALDPDDGSLEWYFQVMPHDVWDYDAVNEPILFDQNGERLLAHFSKNGYLYVLDRTNGRLKYAAPFTRVTWGEVDARTGIASPRLLPTPGGTTICPGPAGGKEWNHAAYSPRTRLLYAPVVDLCAEFTTGPAEFREGMPYWGSAGMPLRGEQRGYLKAIDAATGREVWSFRNEHPMVASVLATAGDLIFTGKPTGEFLAIDGRTGELLWQLQTGSGIHGSPIAYSVRGKQYVAVPSGWGGWVKGFAPGLEAAPRGMTLYVFALP